MGRQLNFDFRRGGGGADEILYGTVTLEPTAMHTVGGSTVLPAPTEAPLVNGLATIPDVAPSPDGPLPEWCYRVRVSERNGRGWSWLVGVPAGSGPVNFKDLPRFDEVPSNAGPGFVGLVEEAVGAKEAAEAAVVSSEASRAAADTAAQAAIDAANLVGAPAGTVVRSTVLGDLNNPASELAARINATIAEVRPKRDLVAQLRAPVWVAHRGGPKRYPEHSMEGYRAAAQSGFLPEMDVHMLADGTLVCVHDATTGRTMTGPDVAVNTLTRADWLARRIKPAITGGKYAVPVLFEDVLDELGGRIVLLAELKNSAPNVQAAVYAAVKSRGLEKCIILGAGSGNVARDIAKQGIYAQAINDAHDPATLVANGVQFAAPSTLATDAYIASLIAAGIKPIVFTPYTKAMVDTQFNRGALGVFVDDPWGLSGRYGAATGDPYREGVAWPLRSGIKETTAANVTEPFAAKLEGASLVFPAPATGDATTRQRWEYQDWAGKINVPCRISARIELGAEATDINLKAGFVLYSNTSNPDAEFRDGALSGQNGFQAVIRRRGTMQVWKYENGGAGVSLGTSPETTAFAAASVPGVVDFTVTITATEVILEAPRHGFRYIAANTFAPSGLRLALLASTLHGVKFKDVQVVNL